MKLWLYLKRQKKPFYNQKVNSMFSIVIFILSLSANLNFTEMPVQPKHVEVNGLSITWTDEGDYWRFKLDAPTEGWVALGYNSRNHIVGTNLIMGAVEKEKLRISDRFVQRFGEHFAVEELGGTNQLFSAEGEEAFGHTIIQFNIPKQSGDKLHYDLLPGHSIWFICAYSREDDFQHHSMMREHIQITL